MEPTQQNTDFKKASAEKPLTVKQQTMNKVTTKLKSELLDRLIELSPRSNYTDEREVKKESRNPESAIKQSQKPQQEPGVLRFFNFKLNTTLAASELS